MEQRQNATHERVGAAELRAVEERLDDALRADAPAEKNYAIRRALQMLVLAKAGEDDRLAGRE